MPEIKVILHCPNSKLLTEPWEVIARDLHKPKSANHFISNAIQMAKAYGEINRGYSKKLPEKYLLILHRRMTRLRNTVKKMSEFRRSKGKPDLIPWQQLEYYFSGEDRKGLKR